MYWDILQVFTYKGIIVDQTPSLNPNLLMTGKSIVFESAYENPQPVTKIAIEMGLKALQSIVYPHSISILFGTTMILFLCEPS